jgi:hypothetical protein
VTQLVFAALLAVVASSFEPGFIPRSAAVFLTFAIPGITGGLGAVRRRAALLLAAGVTSFVSAFIAFSGVTLIFLIPALLFVFGSVEVQVSSPRHQTSIFRDIARAAAAVAIVVLLVGAGASALFVTDATCWAEYHGAAGPRVEPFPYTTGEMSVPGDAMSVSCSTGVISARGIGLAALLWTGALVLAARSSRRRPDSYDSGSGTHWPSATPTATNSGLPQSIATSQEARRWVPVPTLNSKMSSWPSKAIGHWPVNGCDFRAAQSVAWIAAVSAAIAFAST